MDKNILKKLIRELLKNTEEESYCTDYGCGYKEGRIDAIKDILKLSKEL